MSAAQRALVPSPDRAQVTAGERHERNDVDHPNRGWAPRCSQVEPGHRLDRDGLGRALSDQGQDAPVVIRVGVHVEQIAAATAAIAATTAWSPSLRLTTHSST